MIIHLKIIGTLLIALSLLHLGFPNYFKWKTELATLSLINRQMMKVHTFFIALVVMGIGVLSLFYANELIENPFGNTISLFIGIFWFFRLLFQLFVYSTKLWKSKSFETSLHIIFTLFWSYMTTVYGYISLGHLI